MIEVFARSQSGATIAGALAIIVDEWVQNVAAVPPLMAQHLVDGKDLFKRAFPVSLKKNAGTYGKAFGVDMSAHAIEVAVDVDQIALKVWDELERLWNDAHPDYGPHVFLDFGGAEMWNEATKPPPTLMDLDDIEIDSCSSERVHSEIFEGSARHRKGKVHELGIKPNHYTGEIFPGSHDAKPTPGGALKQSGDLRPAGVEDA